MSLIAWREEFTIGLPDVDHEHRELIAMINALHESFGPMDAVESPADYDPEALGRRLSKWFTGHFRTHDSRLHRWLTGRN